MSSPPDLWLSWHSHEERCTFNHTTVSSVAKSIKDVVAELSKTYKIETDQCIGPSSSSDTAYLVFMKFSPAIRARDRIQIVLQPGENNEVRCTIFSKAMDPHVWTALSCNCNEWISFAVCCCGLFPTRDGGENKRFVQELLGHLNLESGRQSNSIEIQMERDSGNERKVYRWCTLVCIRILTRIQHT